MADRPLAHLPARREPPGQARIKPESALRPPETDTVEQTTDDVTSSSEATETATPAVESPAAEAVAANSVRPSGGRLSDRELLLAFEAEQLKSDLPEIFVGDTVRVGVRIREGNKERVQPYEGVVIAKRHGGLNETITVRRIFQGIGVERVFMLHSPQVASVKVERRGKVRRAKLFYLRDRVGKATRVKQRFDR